MKYKYEIIQDVDVESPRDCDDNLGKMICFNRKYSLGDKHEFTFDMFDSWDELKYNLIRNKKAVVILPLYLYDHSGLTIATTPFNCPWDSGRVGFIYADRETILNEYKVKRITKKIRETVTEVLQTEVKTYDQYLRGDVYSYIITAENGEVVEYVNDIYGYNECEKQAIDSIKSRLLVNLN